MGWVTKTVTDGIILKNSMKKLYKNIQFWLIIKIQINFTKNSIVNFKLDHSIIAEKSIM